MKIGFVFDDTLDHDTAIPQYMFCLADWYTAQGHEVHYLTGQTARTDIPHVYSLSRNIPMRFNGNKMTIPLFGWRAKIKQVLHDEQFDVLHVQVPYHPLMAGWIMRLASPKTAIVGTMHVAPFSRFVTIAARPLGWWSRPSSRKFNALVSVSPVAARFARQMYGLDSEIVPNAFNYARFAMAKPLPQYNDDKLTILYFGRLVRRKGSLLLLQAVTLLQQSGKKYPAFRVVIAGGGEMDAQLKRFVANNGLQDIVEFAGRITEADKPAYYASADITALPASGGESFGIVLLEGMASGNAAVLGGDNPGYRSVLGKRPELLVDTDGPAELAKKLDWLLTDDAARQEAAAWGKQECKQYDVAIVGAKLLQLYESCVQNSRNR